MTYTPKASFPAGALLWGPSLRGFGGQFSAIQLSALTFGVDTVSHLLTSCAQDGETTCFRNVYPEGGIRIQRVDARGPRVSAPERIDGYDVVHLAPVMNEVELSPGSGRSVIRPVLSACKAGSRPRDAPSGMPTPMSESGPETARAVVQIPWMPPEDDLRKISIASLGAEA